MDIPKKTAAIVRLILLALIVLADFNFNESTAHDARPNIVLINLDDADRDMFRPEVRRQRFPAIDSIAERGINFTNFHVTNPLCGPSRACLLRGQYAHAINHRTNHAETKKTRGFTGDFRSYVRQGYFDDDIGTWMKQAGYRTVFVGKYINFVDAEHSLPAGWDDFYRSVGSRYYRTIRFTNRSSANGSVERLPKDVYRTNAEAGDVVRLIRKQATAGQPLFVYFAPFGPHSPGKADGGMIDSADKNNWNNIRQPVEGDFNEEDLSDKPASYQLLDPIPSRIRKKISKDYRKRMLAVRSIDRAIDRIVNALRESAILENTYIIITSDNGYSLGQHRICGKGNSFGRSSHVPLIIAGPGIKAGQTANHLLAHIDIAPTLLELAGAPSKAFHDGKSFAPLLKSPASVKPEDWRNAILIENWQSRNYLGRTIDTTFCQLRLLDSIYTEWADGSRDFYDLKQDPLELENSITRLPPSRLEELSAQLKNLRRPMNSPIVTTDKIQIVKSENELATYRIRGVAEDSSGIESVQLIAYRPSANQFWNGSVWQTAYCRVDAKLKNQGGILSEWSCDLRSKQLTNESSCEVMILPIATAQNGNRSSSFNPRKLSLDIWPPVTRIYRVKQVPGNVTRIDGLASDNEDVAKVFVQIQSLDNGCFFNGTSWCRTCQCVPCFTNESDRWEIRFPTPAPGRYTVRARAIDDAGNVNSRWEEKSFSITSSMNKRK